MSAELLSVLLAAIGGGSLTIAVVEAARSSRKVIEPARAAINAVVRAGAEGRAPSARERSWMGAITGIAAGGLVLLIGGPGSLAIVSLAGPWLAGRLFTWRRRRYRDRFVAALPEVASVIADGLSGNASVRRALAEAPASLSGPAASEMRRLAADLELGAPLREALGRLADRAGSVEVEQLAGAIISQGRMGGDLASLLRRHSQAATARNRALAEARAATAQARLTGGIVAALPLAATALVELLSPGFVGGLLADPAAQVILLVAFALQALSFVLIRRLGGVQR